MKEFKLNYKNSIKLLNRALDTDDRLQKIVDMQFAQSHNELRRQINQHIFDLANARGESLWDICYNYLPDIEYNFEGTPDKPTMVARVTLVPLRYEFDKEDEE